MKQTNYLFVIQKYLFLQKIKVIIMKKIAFYSILLSIAAFSFSCGGDDDTTPTKPSSNITSISNTNVNLKVGETANVVIKNYDSLVFVNNSNIQMTFRQGTIKGNTSGTQGVSWSTTSYKWHVYVGYQNYRCNLGFYEDKD